MNDIIFFIVLVWLLVFCAWSAIVLATNEE